MNIIKQTKSIIIGDHKTYAFSYIESSKTLNIYYSVLDEKVIGNIPFIHSLEDLYKVSIPMKSMYLQRGYTEGRIIKEINNLPKKKIVNQQHIKKYNEKKVEYKSKKKLPKKVNKKEDLKSKLVEGLF